MTSGRPPARPFDIAHLDLQLIEDRTLDYLKDKQPTCEHGDWRFAGSDASPARPNGAAPRECEPASRWIKANRLHPLIPRETPRWSKLYKGRASSSRTR
jgi:hypothetical protein